ncbi:type III secretion system export apparatus subunit SctT [Acetobacter sacchari]|uniref:Type III secretion system export apparatus subunit SctT n=1 Tax=Acetobacter sacchari TaxID=2661687 RepID=A0ABS3LX08_9PROT|nr:type III secretion system export apparatus subunit SctT [Acetobacter sacchari]MBO1360448.1 type III secretion system export apparatus subunit SctT [Acetobacter sacchari]
MLSSTWEDLLAALTLAMARPTGAALVLPIFTRAQLGGPIRGAFAFALCLPAAPGIYESLMVTPQSTPALALMTAREMVIGLMVGLVVGLPIWAIQSIGEFIDTQRSATQGQTSESGTGGQESLSAVLLSMMAIALFVMENGLGLLNRTLIESELLWPPLSLTLIPQPGFGMSLLGLLDGLTRTSLTVAAPIMLAMILCDACVILLMRAIPKLHLYDIAPTLRNLAFVMMMMLYSGWLLAYARRGMGGEHHIIELLRTILTP